MNRINIVFTSDQGFVPHLATAIVSLIINNPESSFDIFIINSDIDPSSWDKICSLGKSGNHRFHNILISDELFDGLILRHHFQKQIYYRLLIPELIHSDRVIYLDSDIIVTGNICELYKTDIRDVYLAAVEEVNFTRHKELAMMQDSKYFNSGVMLMNLDMWRRDSMRERVLEFITKNTEVIMFPDQDGMNAIINGCWKVVHPKYNMQTAIYEYDEEYLKNIYGSQELKEAKASPVIIHYTGSIKPWHQYYKHKNKNKYWQYRRRTPYHNYPLYMINMMKGVTPNRIRRVVPNILKNYIKKIISLFVETD
jgi:lipopolysaccharide biosynthesis glycosyltransferase